MPAALLCPAWWACPGAAIGTWAAIYGPLRLHRKQAEQKTMDQQAQQAQEEIARLLRIRTTGRHGSMLSSKRSKSWRLTGRSTSIVSTIGSASCVLKPRRRAAHSRTTVFGSNQILRRLMEFLYFLNTSMTRASAILRRLPVPSLSTT